jgi:hypothetical protein
MPERQPSNPNGKRRPRSAAERQVEQLQQLTKLAASVERLARTAPNAAAQPTLPTPEVRRPTPDVRRARFAYKFLGELLGRRGGFVVPRVEVVRDLGELTFTNLTVDEPPIGEVIGTEARLRAGNGAEETLQNLDEGAAANTTIQNDQPIDAIVVLDNDHVPLAIGPCQEPLEDQD